MNYYIVTGTSRGLGESLVKQLLNPENKVFCLSRSLNFSLLETAKRYSIDLPYYEVNVADSINVEAIFKEIFLELQGQSLDSITLINNAGIVEPITTAGTMTAKELQINVETNLVAPMILTNLFLHYTNFIPTKKVIVNITSGAANHPYSGWSAYCSTKAGLDMFTRTVGLEQQKETHPTTVISFSPGIMNTGMQTTIRTKTSEQFETVAKFKEYKEQGMLRSTDFVAEVLLKLVEEGTLVNGEVYDIKQLI